MTFALNAAKHSSKPIQLLRITIGTSTFRFAQRWLHVLEGGVLTKYIGRIHRFGISDRALRSPGPTIGDLTVELDNKDGSVDELLTAFTDSSKNVIRAKAEVLRGFAGDDVNIDFVTIATFQFGRLESLNDSRRLSLRFSDRLDDLFGELQPPTNRDVLIALVTSFPSTFGGVHPLADWDETNVPIAAGRWGSSTPEECLPEVEAAAFLGTNSITDVYLCAVMPWPHVNQTVGKIWFRIPDALLDDQRDSARISPGSNYQLRFKSGEWAGFVEGTGSLDQDNGNATVLQSFFLGTLGFDVLVLRCTRKRWSGPDLPLVPPVRVPYFPDVDGLGRVNARPVEIIQDVIESFNSKGRGWGTDFVDVASFDVVDDRTNDMVARVFIPTTRRAMAHASKIAEAFVFKLYFNGAGKLAAWAPLYEGGESPAYATARRLTESQDFFAGSLSAEFGQDGRLNGLANRAEVTFRADWNQGDLLMVVDNTESQADHDRIVTLKSGGEEVVNVSSARRVGSRVAFLYGNPRMVLQLRAPFGVAEDELGDIVLVTTKAVPGFSTGKLCIIEGIRPDLDRLDTALTLADWDTELNAKVYLIPDEADFIRLSRGAGETLDVTVASTTLDFFGVNFSTVVEWDIVAVRTWDNTVRVGGDNEFRGVVDTVVDIGGGHWRIVLKVGAGLGQLPDTIETGITDWRILFSSETNPAALDKFGKVAHSGIVLNGGTPYVWRQV